MLAPDIGTLVEHDGNSYRVDGWCKVAPRPAKPKWGDPHQQFMRDILTEILYDASNLYDGNRLQWCIREEATYVALVGVAGAIVKVEDCNVTGRVRWTEDVIEEHRQQALAFVGELV